ncbi:excise [Gordonia phage Yvonnetastic]|uniref:Excise n=1 Tax=Gordonia phage Yvonnetastic TaxID=1821566 RepID=A0A142K970_9CAUD|nr:excise [Gordonia phage Yvonnetastic]AMS02653.1 excise [Gordonia phage Yvonnetastic]WKW86086.1 excise [Gordonia Phage JonJames]
MNNTDEIAVSIKRAAELLGVSQSHIRDEIRAGRIVARRIGTKMIRIKVSELEQYIDARPLVGDEEDL